MIWKNRIEGVMLEGLARRIGALLIALAFSCGGGAPPALLSANGFVIRSAAPLIFCVRPNDYMWQWPATFIETYLPRLIQMGRIDQKFAANVRSDLARAEGNPNVLMITPLVLEVIAEKL